MSSKPNIPSFSNYECNWSELRTLHHLSSTQEMPLDPSRVPSVQKRPSLVSGAQLSYLISSMTFLLTISVSSLVHTDPGVPGIYNMLHCYTFR